MTNLVNQMFDQMQSRYFQNGSNIVGRIDEMSTKIDELENSI